MEGEARKNSVPNWENGYHRVCENVTKKSLSESTVYDLLPGVGVTNFLYRFFFHLRKRMAVATKNDARPRATPNAIPVGGSLLLMLDTGPEGMDNGGKIVGDDPADVSDWVIIMDLIYTDMAVES